MDAAHTFHQNQNNSELMTRRKSVTHLIDQQGCDEQRVTCVATRFRYCVCTSITRARQPFTSEL